MCQLCRSHLHECPFCKAPYEGTRNYAVEEILIELKTAHPENVENGQPASAECENIMSLDELRDCHLSPSSENDHTASSSPSDDEFRDLVIVEHPRPAVSRFLDDVRSSAHYFILPATKLQ